MAFLTAAEIDRRYRTIWGAVFLAQISFETAAEQLAALRIAMRSLGA